MAEIISKSYIIAKLIAKMLGIFSYQRQLYPRAAELLEQAARTLKDDAELLFYLGATFHELKQWTGCKAALERGVSLGLSPTLAGEAKQGIVDCTVAAR